MTVQSEVAKFISRLSKLNSNSEIDKVAKGLRAQKSTNNKDIAAAVKRVKDKLQKKKDAAKKNKAPVDKNVQSSSDKKPRKKKETGSQPIFSDRFSLQGEGRINARTGGDDNVARQLEEGRGGKEKITEGTKSFPRMDEAASKGSKKRAKKVVDLEIEGRTNPEAKAKAAKMDAASKKADEKRATSAAATRSAEARKDKGVSVAGPDGTKIKIGAKQKLKDSDMMVGNTTNGITKDGELIGKPTDNQVATVIRNLDARQKLSEAAKRNLAKLKRMSKPDRQDAALRRMERKMKNTGPDKSGRKYKEGGLAKPSASQAGIKKLPEDVRNKMGYMKKGGAVKPKSTDMRKGGMFY